MSTPKICPVLAVGNPVHMAKCREDGCALFHLDVDPEDGTATGMCAIARIADSLAANSQVLADLQQKGLPGATNTEQAEGGKQSLPDTDSTSTIHENGGNVK